MPWIKECHFYKDFINSVITAVHNISHESVVWFGVHDRITLIRDYLAALGIDMNIILDNDANKQGLPIKRDWCLPLTKTYVSIDSEKIDKIVAGRKLKDLIVIPPGAVSNYVSNVKNTLFITATENQQDIKDQLISLGASESKIISMPPERILWRKACDYFDSIFPDKTPKTMDKHKCTIKKILNVFSKFCKANGLKYYLAYGTLLGAVRHKGIIPWDDDIDVWMPIEDYRKLLTLYPMGGQFEILNHKTNDDYFFPFSKLVNNNTKLHHIGCPITWYEGEYIDIFPVSGYPNDIEVDEWWEKVYLLDIEWYWYYITRDIILSIKDPRERIQNERFINTLSGSKNVGVMMTLPPKPWIYKSNLFSNQTKMKFEGRYHPIPKEYDSILKVIYGNYMQLPPKEERDVHGFPTYV